MGTASTNRGYGRWQQDPPARGRRLWLALAGILSILLIGGAVAAWAYDGAKRDEIASGITIEGIDVGGMTASQAYRHLDRQLVDPLRRPIHVSTDDGEKWTLPAADIDVRAGIAASVRDALEASREPGLPSRIVRYVTGGEVKESFTPEYRYSKPAVTEFIQRVAGAVKEEPVDASVQPTGSSLNVVSGQQGVKLRDNLLTEQIEAAILDRTARRTFRARTNPVDPEVTVDQLADMYPVYLTVDRANFELRLWRDLELVKTYTVALGQAGYDTPTGLYSIQNRAVDPTWHVPDSDWAGDLAGEVIPGGVPENPLKARWLGFYNGAGIHGTDALGSLGTAASHGCVRMAVPDVVELYDQVQVGTPIYVA